MFTNHEFLLNVPDLHSLEIFLRSHSEQIDFSFNEIITTPELINAYVKTIDQLGIFVNLFDKRRQSKKDIFEVLVPHIFKQVLDDLDALIKMASLFQHQRQDIMERVQSDPKLFAKLISDPDSLTIAKNHFPAQANTINILYQAMQKRVNNVATRNNAIHRFFAHDEKSNLPPKVLTRCCTIL